MSGADDVSFDPYTNMLIEGVGMALGEMMRRWDADRDMLEARIQVLERILLGRAVAVSRASASSR